MNEITSTSRAPVSGLARQVNPAVSSLIGVKVRRIAAAVTFEERTTALEYIPARIFRSVISSVSFRSKYQVPDVG